MTTNATELFRHPYIKPFIGMRFYDGNGPDPEDPYATIVRLDNNPAGGTKIWQCARQKTLAIYMVSTAQLTKIQPAYSNANKEADLISAASVVSSTFDWLTTKGYEVQMKKAYLETQKAFHMSLQRDAVVFHTNPNYHDYPAKQLLDMLANLINDLPQDLDRNS